jgi:hypothetical protein
MEKNANSFTRSVTNCLFELEKKMNLFIILLLCMTQPNKHISKFLHEQSLRNRHRIDNHVIRFANESNIDLVYINGMTIRGQMAQ